MRNKNADGLRGIAALCVFNCHFVSAFIPSMLHNNFPNVYACKINPSFSFLILSSPFISLFYNGIFPVLIFFVLSGYVLANPYFSGTENTLLVLKKRLWGRYLRLNIPIFIAIFIAYTVYRLGLYFNVAAGDASGSVSWFKIFYPEGITFLSAVRFALYEVILSGGGDLDPPTWTLKIEFLGSVYLLLYYLSKPRESILFPLLIAFLLLYFIHFQDSIFYFSFLLGSLLNIFKNSMRINIITFALGLYFGAFQYNCIFYDYLPNFSVNGFVIWDKKIFYNAVGAVLLCSAVVQGLGSKILESKTCQFLGKISFSFYLIHFIILCSFSAFMYIKLPKTAFFLCINFLISSALSILLSMIFEKTIDRNSIKISRWFASKLFFHEIKDTAKNSY